MSDKKTIGRLRTPLASRATRKIKRKSSSHFVGQMTFGEGAGQGQCLQFESKLEHDAALLLIYAPGVIDVEEQIEPVSYIGVDGKPHSRTFDFRAIKVCGTRSIVDVKDEGRSGSYAYRDDVSRAAVAVLQGKADKVFAVSKRNIDPDKLQRAQLFHGCRFAQPAIDKKLMDFVREFSGEMVLRDLLAAAGLDGDGFHAAVRLIRQGILSVPDRVRITLSCIVAKQEVAG